MGYLRCHRTPHYTVTLPDLGTRTVSQEEEWALIRFHDSGHSEVVRFHDYARVFSVPGLYETLFVNMLNCRSPQVVFSLLRSALRLPQSVNTLRVLELGPGNGIMGALLREAGARTIVGVDPLPEARLAALRDRPGVYDAYLTARLTSLSLSETRTLTTLRADCLVAVSSLGFCDTSSAEVRRAHSFLQNGAWVAFNVAERYFEHSDTSGLRHALLGDAGDYRIHIATHLRYRHRYSVTGTPIHYVAIVGRLVSA